MSALLTPCWVVSEPIVQPLPVLNCTEALSKGWTIGMELEVHERLNHSTDPTTEHHFDIKWYLL